jgi:hypothetical protein
MSQNNQQTLREQLIACDLWSADDPRDPGTDNAAAEELKRRCEDRFSVVLYARGVDNKGATVGIEPWYTVQVKGQGFRITRHSFPAAMCEMAIQLHQRAI